jgi:hypothetical protein
LKEPVGFKLSNLKWTFPENLTSGVQPSPNVMMFASFISGKKFAYRQRE